MTARGSQSNGTYGGAAGFTYSGDGGGGGGGGGGRWGGNGEVQASAVNSNNGASGGQNYASASVIAGTFATASVSGNNGLVQGW